jgi:hypothetical protein
MSVHDTALAGLEQLHAGENARIRALELSGEAEPVGEDVEMVSQMRYRRRSKFGVMLDPKGVEDRTLDGIVFSSLKECKRYAELKMLERCDYIVKGSIKLQERFPLSVVEKGGTNAVVGHYVADFTYQDRDGKLHIEDAKGFKTPQYRWKKKHFELQYGIRIEET